MRAHEDINNLNEIRQFLTDNNITYSTEYDNFCLNFGTDKQFEIEYIAAREYPVAYPRFGLEGVPASYFSDLSIKAETERHSFKFWIKDYEWINPTKKEILKSYILHAAGATSTQFYARDCEVKVFSNKELRQFQLDNCFYGYRSASLSLGLVLKKDKHNYPKGTLLMVTTFGKNYFAKKADYVEIFRVGTLRNCQVIGGSSKLFQHFIRNYPTIPIGGKSVEYSKVIYYVDYDHGSGKSVEKLGFSFVRYSGGGFLNMDVATGQTSQREPMRHGEIMKKIQNGIMIAIPNAGVKVYEYNVKRNE